MKEKILEISDKLRNEEITEIEAQKQFLFLFSVSNSLPTLNELDTKAKEYSKRCSLQNFYDEDEIILEEMRYMHGYEQAIKDFVNPKYNPDMQ